MTLPDILFILALGTFDIRQVVNPQVDRQGNGFEAPFEYLFDKTRKTPKSSD